MWTIVICIDDPTLRPGGIAMIQRAIPGMMAPTIFIFAWYINFCTFEIRSCINQEFRLTYFPTWINPRIKHLKSYVEDTVA